MFSPDTYNWEDNEKFCELVTSENNYNIHVNNESTRPLINQFFDKDEQGSILAIALEHCGDAGLMKLNDRYTLKLCLHDIYQFSKDDCTYDTHPLITVIGFCGFLIHGLKLNIQIDNELIQDIIKDKKDEVIPW